MRNSGAVAIAVCLGVSAIDGAAASQVVRCDPVLPIFCENIHVSCSGRSAIATLGFDVSFQGGRANIAFDDGTKWLAVVGAHASGKVLRPARLPDWIRIEPSGRFSHRIYRGSTALMSYGQCQPL